MASEHRSTWAYGDKTGQILFEVLHNYKQVYGLLYAQPAKEAHLAYMRQAYAQLRSLYLLARPLVFKKYRGPLENKLAKAKKNMENYLNSLPSSYSKPDYTVIEQFDSIEEDLLEVMQQSGLLYTAERIVSRSEREDAMFGTRDVTKKRKWEDEL